MQRSVLSLPAFALAALLALTCAVGQAQPPGAKAPASAAITAVQPIPLQDILARADEGANGHSLFVFEKS
ncbi:hypothetical protein [Pantoea sp. 18069]|uniref:hypothetical protein n=1 Tax=Pantoea sp. 18069 TaxID=2681415 RepID=UPI001356E9D5|nr:hypothetical protein [Pantoea sp. 18069]